MLLSIWAFLSILCITGYMLHAPEGLSLLRARDPASGRLYARVYYRKSRIKIA